MTSESVLRNGGARAIQNSGLHMFAVVTSVCAFCLIVAGGLVTSTDSGLAVPDWPLSYGQVMPPMVGGIFYEHGHRMVATAVGMLMVILAVWLWRKDERRWVRNLGWVALFAVVVQGVLGGITVLFLLPTAISVAHATLAQSVFCLTVILAVVTSKTWRDRLAATVPVSAQTPRLVLGMSSAIFLQLILGALMRHSQSGLAIPDFPMSYGGLFPPIDSGKLFEINEYRLTLDLAPVTIGQIWIHFAHRLGALIVLSVAWACVRHILTTYRTESTLREPALMVIVLLGVQLFLGALTVWTGKSAEVATAHVAVGALLLSTSVVLTLEVFWLRRGAYDGRDVAFSIQAARS